MKLAIFLVFIIIAAVNVKADDDNSDEHNATLSSEKGISRTSSSVEKRWKPIFPKNTRKFVVTLKPIQSYSPNVNRVHKKPIMFKITPKEVKNEEHFKNVVTRRPLMKFARFTVKPFYSGTHISESIKPSENINLPNAKNGRGRERVERKEKHKLNIVNKDNSSEEKSSNSDNNLNKRNNNQVDRGLQRTTNSPNESTNRNYRGTTIVPKATKRPYFSSEEEEDRKEFIFLKPKTTTHNILKVMQNSAESTELTTEAPAHLPARRLRRSINVIEEENLGTTVSGFKFTGKPVPLSSDLVFKNINF